MTATITRATALGSVPVLALALLAPLTGAAAPGEAAAPASTAATCSTGPEAPKREMRGAWIASVANIDWPSEPGLSPEQAQEELREWYDLAKQRGLNSVVVQVRPTADTFWPSELEPWSSWLTGEQGADPGWDPMAFAVQEAHARGLDFHAWFNPYRVTLTGTAPAALDLSHPGREHPDWLVPYGGKLYYNPGIPAVREHTIDVIMQAVERYDVDGVHFDDYFYPYPVAGEQFDDDVAYAEHAQPGQSRADWRRENVTQLIAELGERVEAAKPWVSFGVSPFAVWRNEATDPQGSATTAGAQTYDDLYADTRLWVQEELIDYIAPQIYWAIGFEPAAYDVLVPWWSDVVTGTDVDLWIGQATYKVGTSTQSPEWSDPAEMTRHLDLNEDYPQVGGDLYFSAKDLRANRLDHVDLLQAQHYTRPALPPVTDAGSAGPARHPVRLSTRQLDGGTELSWVQRGNAEGYAVYRLPGQLRGRVDPCQLADATNLVAVLGPDARTWTDPSGGDVSYVITALAADNTESPPSLPVGGR